MFFQDMGCESVRPVQGPKTPKSEKEGFGVEKPPFPPTPEMGVSSRKTPISIQGTTRKMGIFLARNAHFWGGGKMGVFRLRNPLFPILGFLAPVQGGRIRKTWGFVHTCAIC